MYYVSVGFIFQLFMFIWDQPFTFCELLWFFVLNVSMTYFYFKFNDSIWVKNTIRWSIKIITCIINVTLIEKALTNSFHVTYISTVKLNWDFTLIFEEIVLYIRFIQLSKWNFGFRSS